MLSRPKRGEMPVALEHGDHIPLPASQLLRRYSHQRQLFEMALWLVLVQERRLRVKSAADSVVHGQQISLPCGWGGMAGLRYRASDPRPPTWTGRDAHQRLSAGDRVQLRLNAS